MPTMKDGHVFPMEGPGLGVELLPAVFKRSDLIVRRTTA
jgi:galactonate dehydratase